MTEHPTAKIRVRGGVSAFVVSAVFARRAEARRDRLASDDDATDDVAKKKAG